MTCFKCDGALCQDKMYDLPRAYREYFCVNCGERFWVDVNTRTLELRPLTTTFPLGTHPN